jgi:hypothetical protein
MKYKIKPDIAYRKINDEIFVVDSKNSYLHKIDSVGSFIFEKIKDGLDEEKIVKELVESYDVDFEVAFSDVKEFIEELIKKGIIEKDAK